MGEPGFSLRRDCLRRGAGVYNEGKQVRIRLHDGDSVRYVTSNEMVIDELVGALKQGVAEAKSAKVDWSELA
jgi:hypothetical protein